MPSYLRHKASGQAITVVRTGDGGRRQIYLGPYDSPESHRRYREVLARHLDPARDEQGIPGQDEAACRPVTVTELVAQFLAWADAYYRRPDGSPSREFPNYVAAARPLLQLYRDEPAADFRPLKLKRVRELMVERGWARRSINKQVGRLRRMFKWAVENELVGPEVLARLQAVTGLKRGRTPARETRPTQPVAWAEVEAVLPRVSSVVAAMVLVQWHTGMRPNEVVQMRAGDVERAGPVWVYRPANHKTAYRGREREVFIGPAGQDVLAPFLDGAADTFLFCPAEAERERRSAQRAARATPLWPSHVRAQAARRSRQLQRHAGESYSVDSYRRAIHRACRAAGLAAWSPSRLRHSRATEIRRLFGLEAAQVVLGHASAEITQVYAQRDRELARRVALETG
ncbi:MAG: site-specific integrase [Planctomycetota bacterium]